MSALETKKERYEKQKSPSSWIICYSAEVLLTEGGSVYFFYPPARVTGSKQRKVTMSPAKRRCTPVIKACAAYL